MNSTRQEAFRPSGRTALLLLLGPLSLASCGSTENNPANPAETAAPSSSVPAPVQPSTNPPNTGAPTTVTPPGQPPVNPTTPPVTPATSDTPTGTPSTGTEGEATSSDAMPTASAEGSQTVPDDTTTPEGEPNVMGESFEVNVQLASEVDDKAPTTVGIVTWSTTLTSIASAYVDFGLTTDYGMRATVDLDAADHRTLLLGMKPDQTYHFRVVTSDGNVLSASDDYTVETGPATTEVSIGSFEVLDAAKREPGFFVASYWSGGGSSVAFILDQDGEIVWAYDTGITGGIARARISDDGKDMWVITASNNGGSLRRVGIDGLGGQTYDATVGSHDITPVEGSTMAFIEYGETDCDSIFEIDPSGQVKEVWDSQDLQSGGGGARCHGNAVRYSAAEGVYTFSDVSTDIVQLTRGGELQWKLTETVPGGNTTWGGTQHGHHLLKDSIVVFANAGAESKAGPSAVIEYALADGAELWRYEGANSELSANLGDAQRLPGGNTLVTFSNDSIVHEVTLEREVVLEWTGGPNTRIGYVEWRPSLYGESPFVHD